MSSFCLIAAAVCVTATPPHLAPHPRLRLTQATQTTVLRNIASDHNAAAVFAGLVSHGENILREDVVNCTKAGVESSLLDAARSVLDRLYTLGMLFRLDGNETWALRALKEMEHVTLDDACADWNPQHFLDTAEMMHAVAIGIDWLWDAPQSVFPTSRRTAIAAGLATRGLGAAAKSWGNAEFKTTYNWNLVCNGGMLAASLVLMDDENATSAALAKAIYANASRDIALSLNVSYAPDGAWAEGPTYWGYATKYALLAVDVLRTATGSSLGFEHADGFATTGAFRAHMTGPSGEKWNFGDSDSAGADEFVPNFAGLAALQRRYFRKHGATTGDVNALLSRVVNPSIPSLCNHAGCALTLLDWSANGTFAELDARLPTCVSYRLVDSGWNSSVALGTWRSDWRGVGGNNDTPTSSGIAALAHPTYLAFKGGNGEANHNDADAGSWILEMGGARWAVDLGADSYGLPNYFSKSPAHGHRYSYYRKSTRGHNTLTFGGHDKEPGWSSQDVTRVAPITSFTCPAVGKSISLPHATMDLTPVYANAGGPSPPTPKTSSVQRGFAMASWSHLVIVDEWTSPGAGNVTWSMHFESKHIEATVASDGLSVILASNTTGTGTGVGAKLRVALDSPANAGKFQVVTPAITPPQRAVATLRKIILIVRDPAAVTKIQISLTDANVVRDERRIQKITRRIDEWATLGPFVASFSSSASSSSPTVTTDCGPISGRVASNGVRIFSGIPYAAPPTAERRWQPPVDLRDAKLCWNETLDASSFGAACPQSPGTMDIGDTSEDCLFLNVWTPASLPQAGTAAAAYAPRALLPVMVWIHGGGYVYGSGNYPNYAPTADQARAMGCVLVSLNYRLGPFGWLATKELSANSSTETSGNYGYMDMIAALRWVRRNAAAFGGDRDAVTLYGQSAGGTATMALLAAPSASGLFHRAIMQSGSARYNTTLVEAHIDNAYFLDSAGCGGGGVECLRAASTATLMNAIRWNTYPGWGGAGVSGFPILNFSWGNLAIVDGIVIPIAPVAALASAVAHGSNIPLVIGSTAQETDLFPLVDVRNQTWDQFAAFARRKMKPFGLKAMNTTNVFYIDGHVGDPEFQYTSLSSDIGVNCPNNVIGRKIAAGRKDTAPVYRYVLTAKPSHPMHSLGTPFAARYSFHTLDSIYIFNTTRGALIKGATPNEADAKLTRRLREDMAAFVRGGSILSWTTYPNATMEIADNGVVREIAGGRDYHSEACAFWENNGFFKYSWAGN